MATRQISQEQSHDVFLLVNAPYLPSSMERTKLTQRKEKDGKRWVLRPREVRRVMAEKGWRPLLLSTNQPQPRHPHPEERRWRK